MGNKIKLGVIGDPIDHSLSPLIHSQFGEELGINLEYKPYHVVDSELDNFIKNFFANGGFGLNVTLPHKLNCIRSADIYQAKSSCSELQTLLARIVTIKLLLHQLMGLG